MVTQSLPSAGSKEVQWERLTDWAFARKSSHNLFRSSCVQARVGGKGERDCEGEEVALLLRWEAREMTQSPCGKREGINRDLIA